MQIPQFFSNPITDATQAAQLQNALMQQQIQRRQYEDTLESRRGFEEAMRGQQEQAQAYQVPDMFRYDATQSPEVKAYQAAQTANALVTPAPTSEGNVTIKGTEADRAAEMNQLKAAADARLSQPQGMAYPSTMSQRGWQPPSDASYAYMQGVQQFQQAQQEQQVNFFNNRVKPLYDMWITTKDSSVKQKLMDQVEALRGRPEAGIAVQFMDAVKGVNLSSGGNISAGTIMTDGLKQMLLHGTTSPVMKQVIEGLPSGKPIPFDLAGDWAAGNVTGTEGGKGKGASGEVKKNEFPTNPAGRAALDQTYNLTPAEKAQVNAISRQKGIRAIDVQVNHDGSRSFTGVADTKYTSRGGSGDGYGGSEGYGGAGGAGGAGGPALTLSGTADVNWDFSKGHLGKNPRATEQIIQQYLVSGKNPYGMKDPRHNELVDRASRYTNARGGQEYVNQLRQDAFAAKGQRNLESLRLLDGAIATGNLVIESAKAFHNQQIPDEMRKDLAGVLQNPEDESLFARAKSKWYAWARKQSNDPKFTNLATNLFIYAREEGRAVSGGAIAQGSINELHEILSTANNFKQIQAGVNAMQNSMLALRKARKNPINPDSLRSIYDVKKEEYLRDATPDDLKKSSNPRRRQEGTIIEFLGKYRDATSAVKKSIMKQYYDGNWKQEDLERMAYKAGWRW